MIQQAIEAELAELLSSCANVTTLHGKRAVVRNGYLPGREVLTAAGQIAVKVPKVRDLAATLNGPLRERFQPHGSLGHYGPQDITDVEAVYLLED